MRDYVIETIIYQLGLQRLQSVNGKFNFRCPICGDSAVSQKKRRGWILERNSDYMFHCFNCGVTMPFIRFLKTYYPTSYNDYISQKLLDKNGFLENKRPVNKTNVELKILNIEKPDLPSILDLPKNHKARLYIENRKIPFKFYNGIYYAEKYKAFINSVIENKFENLENDEPRIVIPIYDIFKKLKGFQGRSLDKYAKARYITILTDKEELNSCGLERLDTSKEIFVLEGFFDSLFLPNAISMNSSDIDFSKLEKLASKEKFIFIYDNEKRNKEIRRKMLKVVRNGFRLVIWSNSIKGKDINEMVLNGYPPEYLLSLIKNNIYKGLEAETRILTL